MTRSRSARTRRSRRRTPRRRPLAAPAHGRQPSGGPAARPQPGRRPAGQGPQADRRPRQADQRQARRPRQGLRQDRGDGRREHGPGRGDGIGPCQGRPQPGQLKQASEVPAKTDFVDSAGRASGGAPPENVTGVAILVNTTASRFEDEDYMVAAIRHEMVHARLMRLTLKHLADWKQKPEGLSFVQYVDKKVTGTDGALVKDRFFGGHMDEVVAYAEGFLSAFFYAPIAAPGTEPPRGSPTSRASRRSSRTRRTTPCGSRRTPRGSGRTTWPCDRARTPSSPSPRSRSRSTAPRRVRRSSRTWRRGWSTSTRPKACTGPRSTWSTRWPRAGSRCRSEA